MCELEDASHSSGVFFLTEVNIFMTKSSRGVRLSILSRPCSLGCDFFSLLSQSFVLGSRLIQNDSETLQRSGMYLSDLPSATINVRFMVGL